MITNLHYEDRLKDNEHLSAIFYYACKECGTEIVDKRLLTYCTSIHCFIEDMLCPSCGRKTPVDVKSIKITKGEVKIKKKIENIVTIE